MAVASDPDPEGLTGATGSTGSTPYRRPATALDAVTALLDAIPADRVGSSGGADRTRLGVVAGRSGPRFLVPLDFPHAAPQACLAYLGLRDLRTRVQRGAVGLALKARLARFVTGDVLAASTAPGSLLAFLADVLGHADLAVGVGVGSIDEVWKPTLQVFAPDGTPLAFVKVGLGPVAAKLVSTEADALARWADHPDPRIVVPGLLAATTWNDIPIVVVEPLPADSRRLPPGTPGAMAVRTLDGPPTSAPLASSPWWTDRADRWEDDPNVQPILATIAERHGDGDHEWARWHGDWVPWNLARCHLGLVAWDWEYSEPGAPVGLDETHAAYQVAHVVEGRSVAESLARARAAAPSAWVADAHVAMLATRAVDLADLAGSIPSGHADLLTAARAAVTHR